MSLPPANHPTTDQRRRIMRATLRATSRHTVMLIQCECATDYECFLKLWYPCEHPGRVTDDHTAGGECPRCMIVICQEITGL